MAKEFPKAYQPHEAEKKWYDIWINNKLFSADNSSYKPGYSILMPPPNVTGILHFGHVLNMTIQDLFIRRKKMLGYEVCWFPGTDHAGIATQTRVESELRKDGLTRYDLGRDKFTEKVWEWKKKYGDIIFKQMYKLGASADWDRSLFTMDDTASEAVQFVFIKLFDDGLIYKGKRIINWSPLSQTALSDEEVDFREVNEHLYTMRYYYEDGSDYLCVATVRPETIFGDVAIAVNPNDERYSHLVGKKVRVPICNRLIEVITDEYADPQFGTGCVKITPAHDPNDFLVGERHNLEKINTINPDGTMNEFTGEFNSMDRFEARKAVLKKLKELDLIEKIEEYKHNVGFSQRGGEPIEPYLSDQWFVNMKPLAEIALNVVLEGKVKFHPNHWVKTFEHWMTNIRDWCISRQLWWGHRIPVYYAPDGQFTAAANAEEARLKLGLSSEIELVQDNDVLDTWFSSWLWQMTTMRWKPNSENDDSSDMLKFLPTDLLVTAPDIIFFWVARMIMASVYFKNVIPFKDVYFTSLIRDGQGRKLSKSLGNSPDPLNIIDKYGADAVRFTMLFLSPLGQDVKMDVNVESQDIPSVEIGRNFCNKIWNAGRFLLMKDEQAKENNPNPTNSLLLDNELTICDKWILSRFNSTICRIDEALENYKVNDYSKIIYDFVWRDFCDWYVEIVKIQYNNSEDQDYRIRLMNSVIHLYENMLKLLHPIVPFITEEIWHLLGDKDENENIINQDSPKVDSGKIIETIEFNFELLQNIIEEIRRLRSTTSIAPSQKLPVIISTANKELFDYFSEIKQIIKVLGKCSELEITSGIEKPEGSLASIIKDVEIFVVVGGSINIEQEKARLDKEIQRLENLIMAANKKLSNEKFVNNASPEIVAKEREKLESMENSLKVVLENYKSL